MQKNKILAVYPDLCDHGYISDAFMDSANEVVCVTCIIEAVKCLVEYTFIMVLVDSKMVANGNDSITTTLKTITDSIFFTIGILLSSVLALTTLLD